MSIVPLPPIVILESHSIWIWYLDSIEPWHPIVFHLRIFLLPGLSFSTLKIEILSFPNLFKSGLLLVSLFNLFLLPGLSCPKLRIIRRFRRIITTYLVIQNTVSQIINFPFMYGSGVIAWFLIYSIFNKTQTSCKYTPVQRKPYCVTIFYILMSFPWFSVLILVLIFCNAFT